VKDGAQDGKRLCLVSLPDAEDPTFNILDQEVIHLRSSRACGNDSFLLDSRENTSAIFYDLRNNFKKIEEIESHTSKVAVMCCLAGESLDVFILSDSKKCQDVRVYDASPDADANSGRMRPIDNNIVSAMKGMAIQSIRLVQGGGRSGDEQRNICVVDHDEGEQTLFEVDFSDKEERSLLVFKQIMQLDQGFYVFSNLINDNKIVIYCQKDNSFLLFNVDMKVYWQVAPEMRALFNDTESFDQSFFFVPDSGTDGLITRLDSTAQLVHSNMKEKLLLTERAGSTQDLIVHHLARDRQKQLSQTMSGMSREILVLT